MEELIVLVNDKREPIGTAPKLASHHADTPLHLAFSCYIFDDKSKVLVTRRALSKKVWPGVWSNSVCGHPGPDETLEAAIERRAQQELGMTVRNIKSVLPDYRYRTPPFNGIIENEICPVFVAEAGSEVKPNDDEVADYKWLSWKEFGQALQAQPELYSYWTKDQFPKLEAVLAK